MPIMLPAAAGAVPFVVRRAFESRTAAFEITTAPAHGAGRRLLRNLRPIDELPARLSDGSADARPGRARRAFWVRGRGRRPEGERRCDQARGWLQSFLRRRR